VIANGLIIILSSRVSDPRAAQQLSSALVLPFLIIFLGHASGWIVLGVRVALTIAAVLLAGAGGCLFLAVRLFHRDAILTRWK
jgi:ABC-2 type transport system permease protein